MTTWVTFETIDESQNWNTFYIDRLGMHQYRADDRTRFEIRREMDDDKVIGWLVYDLEPETNQPERHFGTMRDVIQWVAGRTLYGA